MKLIIGLVIVVLVGGIYLRFAENENSHTRSGQTKVHLKVLKEVFDEFHKVCSHYPDPSKGFRGIIEGGIEGCDVSLLPKNGKLIKPPKDAWGNPFYYKKVGTSLIIGSFGANGVKGGAGQDEDLSIVITDE